MIDENGSKQFFMCDSVNKCTVGQEAEDKAVDLWRKTPTC